MKKKTYTYVVLNKAENNKTFSNCQVTYQKELCLLFEKIRQFFLTERTLR